MGRKLSKTRVPKTFGERARQYIRAAFRSEQGCETSISPVSMAESFAICHMVIKNDLEVELMVVEQGGESKRPQPSMTCHS